MSQHWNHEDESKYQLFNGPQRDPTAQHRRRGMPYHARRSVTASGRRVLMPDDFMPIGPHASKHLRAVPPDYLLWVDQQPWSQHWAPWAPVHDFIERCIISDPDTAAAIDIPAGPLIFVDPVQKWPTDIKCFQNGSSHLHTLPGHLDLLETFAIGALRLNCDWMQHKQCPHFDLTPTKHQLAIAAGAVQIARQQMAEHITLWRQFRDAQPKPADDPPTHTRLPHTFLESSNTQRPGRDGEVKPPNPPNLYEPFLSTKLFCDAGKLRLRLR